MRIKDEESSLLYGKLTEGNFLSILIFSILETSLLTNARYP